MARDAFIWDGYMTAGVALIHETERQPSDRDLLIYPILFKRHGLEAAMKWMIEQYGFFANVVLEPDDRNHDLWGLWEGVQANVCGDQGAGFSGGRINSGNLRGVERLSAARQVRDRIPVLEK